MHPLALLYGRTVRGPMMILKQLWTKEEFDSEVKTSYQYVVDLREKMEETLKIAQEELKRSQKRYQQYYNRKAKPRKLQAGDKVLILLPTDKNKLLLQWKGPFEVESSAGVNDYRIKVGEKSKTFHVNLLKKYVERVSTPNGSFQVAGASIIEGSEGSLEEAVDDDDLLELGSTSNKESVAEVTFGGELNQNQRDQAELLVGRFAILFTDKPGSTNMPNTKSS